MGTFFVTERSVNSFLSCRLLLVYKAPNTAKIGQFFARDENEREFNRYERVSAPGPGIKYPIMKKNSKQGEIRYTNAVLWGS